MLIIHTVVIVYCSYELTHDRSTANWLIAIYCRRFTQNVGYNAHTVSVSFCESTTVRKPAACICYTIL